MVIVLAMLIACALAAAALAWSCFCEPKENVLVLRPALNIVTPRRIMRARRRRP